ncbi:MAG: tetratricopeptide repeat protein [Myxococcota bacterium]|nr:tetratricopeptide repeat protein [Myxococcota bacterium]
MNWVESARGYRESGDYSLALESARRSPGAWGRIEESRALIWLGHYEAALAAARQAAAESSGISAGAAYTVLSEALVAVGQPGEAMAVGLQAVALASAVPLSNGLALVALASAEHAQGRGPEAIATATRAIAVLTEAEVRPQDIALGTQALAESCHVARQYGPASEAWNRTLALRREVLPADHPELGVTLSGMALTARRLGLSSIAVELHGKAMAIYRARFDPGHPALAACLHGLAQALHRQGRFVEARDHLAEALHLSEQRQGSDHMHTWITRFELGRMEVDCGDPERGFARMEAARMRLTEQLGDSHPTVRAMAEWL